MKVTVVLPGPLLDVSRGKSRVEVEPEEGTVAGAFEALRRTLPGVYDRFMTEQRELRPHVNVFVGVEDTRWTGGLATPLREGNEVYVLPAVSGGLVGGLIFRGLRGLPAPIEAGRLPPERSSE